MADNKAKLNFEQFEAWEIDMFHIFKIVEMNESRINEILYHPNLLYRLFNSSEMSRLIKENKKLLDYSESKFKEL